MRHFFGGWALGTLVGAFLLIQAARNGELWFYFLWAGIFIGPLFGLAAWGLLP